MKLQCGYDGSGFGKNAMNTFVQKLGFSACQLEKKEKKAATDFPAAAEASWTSPSARENVEVLKRGMPGE